MSVTLAARISAVAMALAAVLMSWMPTVSAPAMAASSAAIVALA